MELLPQVLGDIGITSLCLAVLVSLYYVIKAYDYIPSFAIETLARKRAIGLAYGFLTVIVGACACGMIMLIMMRYV